MGISGLAELATHDLNHDGVINAQDTVHADLRVWRDLNQNTRADDGEMLSLAQAGIASISLATQASGDPILGNAILATGRYTRMAALPFCSLASGLA